MTVLFANPPWWDIDPTGRRILGGVRGGPHRAFLAPVRSAPDQHRFGDYVPHPHLLASAAAHVAASGVRVAWRDSIVLRESYDAFFNHVRALAPDVIVLASSSESLAHDAKILRQLARLQPRARLVLSGDFEAGSVPASLALHARVPAECELAIMRVLAGATGIVDSPPLDAEALNLARAPWCDAASGHLYCDPIPHGELPTVCPRFPQVHVRTARTGPARRYAFDFLEAHIRDLLARCEARSVYFAGDGDDLDEARLLGLAALMTRFRTQWSAALPSRPLAASTWFALRRSGCHGVRIAVDPAAIYAPHDYAFAAVAENIAAAKALGLSAHAGFLHREWGDHPAAKRAAIAVLGANPACHSLQDHAPSPGAFIASVETRTPLLETLVAA